MIVSRKIAEMFKHPGFVNIDYLVKNKLERTPSKILNIINRDWRKWIKPACMLDGGGVDPTFGRTTAEASSQTIQNLIKGTLGTPLQSGTADKITASLSKSGIGTHRVKCALYTGTSLNISTLLTNGVTAENTYTAAFTKQWIDFVFNAPKPSITADDDTWIMAWANLAAAEMVIYYNSVAGWYMGSRGVTYNSFPSSLTGETISADFVNSIYCTYSVAGWTGKISGVTNPAKVMGVAATDISKVKGVS